jgi:excinuclease UvrABC ATPase subunit
MERPDVDSIDGLSPAISIEQKSTSHNPRSTVGTITEIYDYLRLLFARVGEPRCPDHNEILEAQAVSQMVDQVMALPEGTRVMVLAPTGDVIDAATVKKHLEEDDLFTGAANASAETLPERRKDAERQAVEEALQKARAIVLIFSALQKRPTSALLNQTRRKTASAIEFARANGCRQPENHRSRAEPEHHVEPSAQHARPVAVHQRVDDACYRADPHADDAERRRVRRDERRERRVRLLAGASERSRG